ncbi:hypothetical protein [Nocardioides guangzhouensis]|nr:hypothetical protein [Nocardioides guangzhouensis]
MSPTDALVVRQSKGWVVRLVLVIDRIPLQTQTVTDAEPMDAAARR